ncbi:MAG: lycopene cyclase domain-containing protein [Opitutaceae bacterium]|nr:lycopene cyclase domain-containing protein [Cytophagales bacterium]
MKFTYLILNLFTLIPVMIFSFDRKLRFHEKWKYTFPGILIVGSLFTIWDYYFTLNKIWYFNPAYVLDFRLFLMPVEEYLFFLFTPFACLFIYESINQYYRKDWLLKVAKPLTLFFLMLSIGIAISNIDKTYTAVNFSVLTIVLSITFLFAPNKILGQFWLAFFVHLIPFWIINGVLTSWPVIVYNNNENLNIRVGSIPLEDHAYSLILFLSNLCAYEWFKKEKP